MKSAHRNSSRLIFFHSLLMTSMHLLYDRPGLVASLFFMGFFVAAACLAGEAVTLHVAPDGDDRADGSVDAPFATITRARDEIRVLK